jgi:hypothetical protein
MDYIKALATAVSDGYIHPLSLKLALEQLNVDRLIVDDEDLWFPFVTQCGMI